MPDNDQEQLVILLVDISITVEVARVVYGFKLTTNNSDCR